MTTSTATQRFADWPERLAALLAERRLQPFAWGVHDCCLFAADAVQTQTGKDPAASLRGSYATAAEAARLLASRGGLRAIAQEMLGRPLPLPSLAGRGDVACVQIEGRETMAVVVDGGRWAAPGEAGLVFGPLDATAVAWKV